MSFKGCNGEYAQEMMENAKLRKGLVTRIVKNGLKEKHTTQP